jgi:hypothetical protein
MEPKQRWTYFEDVLTNGFSNTILMQNLKYANFDLDSRLLSLDLATIAEFIQSKEGLLSGLCSLLNLIFAPLKNYNV